eukprot:12820171-Alexandrium_andersonii.AAC.1
MAVARSASDCSWARAPARAARRLSLAATRQSFRFVQCPSGLRCAGQGHRRDSASQRHAAHARVRQPRSPS